jgi:hypothetical protein
MSISFNPAGRTGVLWFFIAALIAAPVCLCIMQLGPLLSVYAEAPDNISAVESAYSAANIGEGWQKIDTEDFTVYYEDGVDLDNVARRLRKKIFFFGRAPSHNEDDENNIGYRLDSLFGRAREILDMYPEMPKIKIKIFSDEDSLYKEYRKLTGSSNGWTRAFYVHFYRTIFTSGETITDSVMAHEMAHAIIDHYYKSIPSPQVSEALASYIDMHISD